MESPVVVDKPPEYGNNANERGFPFDEEETGAWSELAARHPDIAARLRQRPATWARKRRPSSQDADDFGDSFGGFDRFPFDDIPPEFREHFPSHWNRRYGPREEAPPPQPQQSPAPPNPPAQQNKQNTAATQTDDGQPQTLPQYGLRNTVDLGQKSAADPSLVDADDRNQRSMSAPPDGRSQPTMSAPNHQEQPPREGQQSNVRVIPIVVEGRDEPVINKNVDHGTHFGEAKPGFAPPPQPHIDREQYFADEGPMGYAHPPNFTRSFGAPYSKFRQGPQPFVHQKVYPQSATAFGRGPSPQRSQSPAQHPDVKVPVHHEQAPPPPPPPRAPQRPAPQQHQPHQHQQPPPQQHPPQQQQRQPTPPPKPQPPSNDPITQILSIQTDVLNLMTDVENFKGTKKDKSYLYLDEMLTRNLIKLDNIETEGKENIRQARKEAIKCIQKCIAVLEAKAEGNNEASAPQSEEVEMAGASPPQEADMAEQKPNGEVEMTEAPKDEAKVEPQPEQKADEKTVPAVADTRPNETPEQSTEAKPNAEPTEQNEGDKKAAPKKGAKNTKKRDKSKENKDSASNKEEKVEAMQIDGKGDKSNTHMEVDASSQ